MPRLPVKGEDVLDSAEIAQVGDLRAQFLPDLANNSLLTVLAEVDGSTEGAVERLSLCRVASLFNKDELTFPEHANSQRPDLRLIHFLLHHFVSALQFGARQACPSLSPPLVMQGITRLRENMARRQ